VNGDRQVQLDSKIAELMQPGHLDLPLRRSSFFEVEADLAHSHHSWIGGESAKVVDGGR
jgi:phenylpropionate dioxygenase-like ring-hydroxylating dioxygenase large terminal subunit